ncbi:MAG TPA: hypothetical protein VFW40_07605 [Capsulimonadaceae bacterium]|nr:hypothetical protein [Capsulimonadaceae bacterium]
MARLTFPMANALAQTDRQAPFGLKRRSFQGPAALAILGLLALGLGALFVSSLTTLIALCLATLLAIAGYLWLQARCADYEQPLFLPRLFLVAYGLRLLAAFAIFFLDTKGVFTYDQTLYWDIGQQWAAHWRGDSPLPPTVYLPSTYYYSLWVGALDRLTLDTALAPCVVNAFLGAMLVYLLYQIADKHLGAPHVGRCAALMVAFIPGMVIWSALNMRDTIAVFFTTLALREIIELRGRVSFTAFARLAVWCVGIGAVRAYVIPMLAVAFCAGLLAAGFRGRTSRLLIPVVLVGLIAAFLVSGGIQELVSQMISLQYENLEGARQGLAYGNAAYLTDIHLKSTADIARFLPIMLVYFLGGPFLWLFSGLQAAMLVPELIAWYTLMVLAARGLWIARRRFPAALPIMTFLLVASVLYSLVSGNFGTAIRHRAQLVPSMILLASLGWPRRRIVRFAPGIEHDRST